MQDSIHKKNDAYMFGKILYGEESEFMKSQWE